MARRNKQNNSVIDYRTWRAERARLEIEYADLVAEMAVARAKKRLATTKPKAQAKKDAGSKKPAAKKASKKGGAR